MTDYTSAHERQAVELRQYQEITRAVQAATCTYAKRTGSRINPDEWPPEDLAASAYIIAQETTQRPGDTKADHIRRAAYEAVRRATRDQQRHAHLLQPDDQSEEEQSPCYCPIKDQALGDMLEGIAIRQAIQQAGPIAALLAQGYTPTDIARRLRVSMSTAWRLADRAREQIRQALGIAT